MFRPSVEKLVKFNNKFTASLKNFRSDIMFTVQNKVAEIMEDISMQETTEAEGVDVERDRACEIRNQYNHVLNGVTILLMTLQLITDELEK